MAGGPRGHFGDRSGARTEGLSLLASQHPCGPSEVLGKGERALGGRGWGIYRVPASSVCQALYLHRALGRRGWKPRNEVQGERRRGRTAREP